MYKNNLIIIILLFLIAGCAPIPKIIKPTKPEIVVTLSTTSLEPGHAIKIVVQGSQAELEIKANGWWGSELNLLPIADQPMRYIGYVTVPLDLQPGPYKLDLTARSAIFPEMTSHSYAITVVPRSPFKISRLSIKSFGKYDFASESAVMAKARKEADFKQPRELESFIWPVKGRLTGKFGTKRIYNNGMKSWYHGGLDIAAPGGTIIVAPADGQVILSRDFVAHGKTILLDHGFGIITTYLHQNKRLVEVGDYVKQGQPIGHVGTTGSSTGNHLHFQVNINNTVSSPYDFLIPNN